jgi:hypothetical protein
LPLPPRAWASVPSGSAAGSYVNAAALPCASWAISAADDNEPVSSSELIITS